MCLAEARLKVLERRDQITMMRVRVYMFTPRAPTTLYMFHFMIHFAQVFENYT